ncbi:ATP-dependent translocase ABCB1-like [Dysidea avara]|uniref:ATP-dependent translocase ABCB1-like n=1 Tax=Dysidea avara TaxID=196820 RepID=UPI003327F0F1
MNNLREKRVVSESVEEMSVIDQDSEFPPKKVDDGSESEDDSKKSKARVAGLLEIFRFATGLDWLLMAIGSIAAVAHGVTLPLLMVVFGETIDAFSNEFITRQLSRAFNLSVENVNCTALYTICENATQDCQFFFDNSLCTTGDELIEDVNILVIYFCALGVVAFVGGWMHVAFFQHACERQLLIIRKRFFRSVLRQEIGWFDVNSVGELNSRLSDDMDKIHGGIGDRLSTFIQWTSSFFGGIVVGFIYDWRLTLVMLGGTPFLVISAAFVVRMLAKFSSEGLKEYASAGAVAEEVFSSIRTVISFGGQQKEIDRYSARLKDARKVGIKKGFSTGLGIALTSFFIFFIHAVGYWFGAYLIQYEDATSGEVLTVFVALLIGAFSLGQAAPSMQDFAVALGAAGFIYDTIDREPLIDSQSSAGLKPEKFDTEIVFDNIRFTYPARPDVEVLKGLDVRIRPGQTLALVGPSGCGKSTITQLLQRFYDPDQGKVTVGGYDVKELNLRWLRSNIGVVSQEPVLFATTIAENIRYGKDDVTEEEMIAAAEAANAHSFISQLPDGYNTLVGEMGTQLSGGQKQRIAIARAIVRDPKILILDEATSALDAESESLVQAALDQASHGRTTIIIAHRLSTIQGADVIAAIVDGKLAESGNHQTLLMKKGVYFDLVQAQSYGGVGEVFTEDEIITGMLAKYQRQASAKGSASTPTVSKSFDKQFSRQQSTQPKETKEDEELGDEHDQALPDPSLWRVVRASAPEWYLILIGVIASAVDGAIFPSSALFMGELFEVYADPRTAEEEGRLWSLLFVALAGVAGLVAFLRMFCFSVSGEALTARLRSISFKAIMRQDIGWFDQEQNSTGALTTRLSHDASQVQGATGTRLGAVTQIISGLLTGITIAFIYGWLTTLLILLAVPVMMVSNTLQTKLVIGVGGNSKKAYEKSGSIAFESISNIRTVVALGLEDNLSSKYNDSLYEPYKKALKSSIILGIGNGFSDGFVYFMDAIVFRFGTFLITLDEDHSLHEEFNDIITVFFALFFGILSAAQASTFLPNYAKARLSAKRIFAMEDLVPAIDSYSEEGEKPENIDGQVSLEKVEFKYATRPDVPVLQGLSLSVKSGQTLALVGPSGCGKSTVVSLLERFYDPENGNVQLDGMDIKQLNIQWLRYQMGLVSQEPTLFDCSIADNIRYGDNFREVSDEEVEEAAKSANIHDFITSLPQGYSTNVGSRGTQLSGGQKQRIAIARALVRKPKILLLDEATSALDTESEKVVQEALDKAREGRTSVVIAHRLSTIHNADLIIVIKDGKAIEAGTHSELMSQKGVYYKLNEAQMMLTE